MSIPCACLRGGSGRLQPRRQGCCQGCCFACIALLAKQCISLRSHRARCTAARQSSLTMSAVLMYWRQGPAACRRRGGGAGRGAGPAAAAAKPAGGRRAAATGAAATIRQHQCVPPLQQVCWLNPPLIPLHTHRTSDAIFYCSSRPYHLLVTACRVKRVLRCSEGDRLSGLVVDAFHDTLVVASSAAWIEKCVSHHQQAGSVVLWCRAANRGTTNGTSQCIL